MQPKRYIVWSKNEIDLSDEYQKKWYIAQVLSYGRAEDVASLDWGEIKRLLPDLNLPPTVRSFWEYYYSSSS